VVVNMDLSHICKIIGYLRDGDDFMRFIPLLGKDCEELLGR
jgi:hypothetical protein